MADEQTRLLAVASAGAPWDDLMLLLPTLSQTDTRFATTRNNSATDLPEIAGFLPDCRLSQPIAFVFCLGAAVRLMLRSRPTIVVSTGGAPGLACILVGRLSGARTLWIDSLVNSEKLSSSGRLASFVANQCWTQWEHLADGKRLRYFGSTI